MRRTALTQNLWLALWLPALFACGAKSEANPRPEVGLEAPGTENTTERREDAGTAGETTDSAEVPPSSSEAPTVTSSETETAPEIGTEPEAVTEVGPETEVGPAPNTDTEEPTIQPPPATNCSAPNVTYSSSATAIATSLAFTLWGSAPDEQLLIAAEAGNLANAEQIEVEVRRMLEDPKATAHLSAFAEWWLSGPGGEERTIIKDPALFPEFTPTLEAAIRQETRSFTANIVASESGTLGELLGAPYTFANETLAPLYGQSLNGEDFERVDLNAEERAGLFTQPYFLSFTSGAESNPVRRGFLLRERLLCTTIPAPPLVSEEPQIPEGMTVRQYYESVLAEPSCWTCHQYGTGLGFAFENYDALGRFRTQQAEQPIDARAVLVSNNGDAPQEFTGAPALLRALAQQDATKTCFTLHWLAFLLGRPVGDAVNGLPFYVLENVLEADNGCDDAAVGQAEPCIPDFTVANFADATAACARGADGDLNLRELSVAIATTPLLIDGTFACGSQRCLKRFEWCSQTSRAAAAGEEAPVVEERCAPYQGTESGCDLALASAPECSCNVAEDGGATLLCQY